MEDGGSAGICWTGSDDGRGQPLSCRGRGGEEFGGRDDCWRSAGEGAGVSECSAAGREDGLHRREER